MHGIKKHALAFASLSTIVALAHPAFAGTLVVPSQHPTIQAAIDAASDGDEVVLADGVFTGPGNRDLRFGGRAITVRSANGPAACTIDLEAGNQPVVGFIFDADEGPNARIEGITLIDSGPGATHRGVRIDGASPTIVDCVFDAIWEFGAGSAVQIIDGAPRFESCTFDNCIAEMGGAVNQITGSSVFEGCTFRDCEVRAYCAGYGGAIASQGGSLTLLDCQFETNRAANDVSGPTCLPAGEGYGGAIHVTSTTIDVRDCEFTGNVALGDAQGDATGAGGAISIEGSTGLLDGCTFASNAADPDGDPVTNANAYGGALRIAGSSVQVRNCSFTNNVASGVTFDGTGGANQGGAVWIGTADAGPAVGLPGDGVFVNCRFAGNIVDYTCLLFCPPPTGLGGGAVAITADGSGTFVNCLITGNIADHGGGAIAVAGALELIHCTVADNVDPDAPVRTTVGGTTTARNSIVRTTQASAFVGGGVVDAQFCNFNGASGPNLDDDPLFVDVGAGDYRLADGSPVVDRGDLASLPADTLDVDDDGDVLEPLPVDLDGASRVVDAPTIDGEVDLGAYEHQGPTTTPCPDLNDDDRVGFADLTALLEAWGPCGATRCPADLDGNGVVGFADLTTLLQAWGPCVS